MVLDTVSGGDRVHGFSGCNRFSGSYVLHDERLHFEHLASTRMACMEGMAQEQHFLKALERSTRYRISGDGLALYGDDEQMILRFEPTAPKKTDSAQGE